MVVRIRQSDAGFDFLRTFYGGLVRDLRTLDPMEVSIRAVAAIAVVLDAA